MKLVALVLIQLLVLPWDEALMCYECDGDFCVPNHCEPKEDRCMTFRDVGSRPTGGCTTEEHCRIIQKKFQHRSSCCSTDFCNQRE
ncbi:long neurotoxin 1-like [Ambystoma mexicanum]|uniref:long neurotoxin 1-like n=1 Tax=Ambystoma mexicanum TaxID=8296 RepID=UPI0037E7377D